MTWRKCNLDCLGVIFQLGVALGSGMGRHDCARDLSGTKEVSDHAGLEASRQHSEHGAS